MSSVFFIILIVYPKYNSGLQFLLDLTNEKRGQYVNVTRYITYFGLCVATCIIFQSSTWLAATVGLGVAAYISLSEYWIKNTPEPTAPSQKILEAAMGMQN